MIKGNSHWSPEQRWAGAALLWAAVIGWGGILEAKMWVRVAETLRVLATAAVFLSFSGVNTLETLVITGVAVLSLVWVWRYFAVSQAAIPLPTSAIQRPQALPK